MQPPVGTAVRARNGGGCTSLWSPPATRRGVVAPRPKCRMGRSQPLTPAVIAMAALFSAMWAGTVYTEDMNRGVMDRMLAAARADPSQALRPGSAHAAPALRRRRRPLRPAGAQ